MIKLGATELVRQNLAAVLGHTDPDQDPRVRRSMESLEKAGFAPRYLRVTKSLSSPRSPIKMPLRIVRGWIRHLGPDRFLTAFNFVISLIVGILSMLFFGDPVLGLFTFFMLFGLRLFWDSDDVITALKNVLSRLHRATSKPARDVRIVKLRRLRPQLIYAHEHVALGFLREYWSGSGRRPLTIWDAHELYPAIAWTSELSRRKFLTDLNYAQSYIDGFVTVNSLIAAEYRSSYPWLPQAHTSTNAAKRISLPRYDGRLHREAGLPSNCRIVLYQGGFAPFRGIEKLIEISRHLGPGWAVVFMGSGKLENVIAKEETLRAGPESEGSVRLIPPAPHDELPLWTLGATVGALLYESVNSNQRLCSPNKLWEYASAGVPIIANNLPFVKAKILKEGIGWTVSERATPAQIARTIVGKETVELQKMSQRALDFSSRENWDSEVAKLSEFLKSFKSQDS